MYKVKSKSESIAIFVAIFLALALFILPSFGLVRYTPQTVDLRPEVVQDNVRLDVYEVRVGEGREAHVGDRIMVHYEGRLTDGTVFDSSYTRDPFSFVLGEGAVIDGWDQGLRGMHEGAIRVLIIPPELGYGDRVLPTIPANSTLIFEVELIQVGEGFTSDKQ